MEKILTIDAAAFLSNTLQSLDVLLVESNLQYQFIMDLQSISMVEKLVVGRRKLLSNNTPDKCYSQHAWASCLILPSHKIRRKMNHSCFHHVGCASLNYSVDSLDNKNSQRQHFCLLPPLTQYTTHLPLCLAPLCIIIRIYIVQIPLPPRNSFDVRFSSCVLFQFIHPRFYSTESPKEVCH